MSENKFLCFKLSLRMLMFMQRCDLEKVLIAHFWLLDSVVLQWKWWTDWFRSIYSQLMIKNSAEYKSYNWCWRLLSTDQSLSDCDADLRYCLFPVQKSQLSPLWYNAAIMVIDLAVMSCPSLSYLILLVISCWLKLINFILMKWWPGMVDWKCHRSSVGVPCSPLRNGFVGRPSAPRLFLRT